MSWQEKINAALAARRTTDALRRRYPVTQGAGRWLVADDRQYLNFSSNDYLGLSHHPQIIRAWQQGAEQFGVGSGGSGHVSGYSVAHQALEEELADLFLVGHGGDGRLDPADILVGEIVGLCLEIDHG